MKTLHYFAMSGLIIFFLMLPHAAFALVIPSPFISSTDKTEYAIGDTIRITGDVANEIIKPNQPVRIQIFSPDGTQYDNATVNLEQHGSYSNGFYNYGYVFFYDLKIRDGAPAGNYQIMEYYDKSLWSSYTITYDKSHTNFDQYSVYNMYINNKTYPIRYKLTEGNEIHGISSIDTGNNFFNIAVRGIENKTGQITVELPRQMIDSKYYNSTDKNFTIAMGVSGAMIGYTNNFKEIQTNAENRILQFEIVPYDADYLIFVYGTQSMNQNAAIQNNPTSSPLKQFKSGIKAEDVKCSSNYHLIIKAEDGSPACVTVKTGMKLVLREWAFTFGTGISTVDHTQDDPTKNIIIDTQNNTFGVTALVKYTPYDACLGYSCPPYTYYLKMNSNSTAYLFAYDICGKDLCVKKNGLSILLPLRDPLVPNYTNIGLDENSGWNYGDTTDITLYLGSTPNSTTIHVLNIQNSTIVP